MILLQETLRNLKENMGNMLMCAVLLLAPHGRGPFRHLSPPCCVLCNSFQISLLLVSGYGTTALLLLLQSKWKWRCSTFHFNERCFPKSLLACWCLMQQQLAS
jgi:hypothetical protein